MQYARIFASALVLGSLAACHSDSDSDALESPLPIVVNTGLAAGEVYGSGLLRVVAASEADQERDLDGDGDLLDFVVQILDVQFKTLVNTGLALVPTLPRDGVPRLDAVPPPNIESNDELAVFVVSELATGADANQNGIPGETTTWVADRRTGRQRSLSFAHQRVELDGELAVLVTLASEIHVFDARDDSVTTLLGSNSRLLLVREDFVAFGLSEDGALDLNGDGDRYDSSVLQLYDARTRTVANTGWATHDARWARRWLGFHVDEREQGRDDLDGEPGYGTAFVAIHPATGAERVPGIASTGFASLAPRTGRFLLQQNERVLGDRNDDGDSLDLVPQFYDAHLDRLHAPRLATSQLLVESWPRVGIVVDEWAQGGQDLDGDGQASTGVLHVLDVSTEEVLNLGLAGTWIGADQAHLYAARSERGEDLNGDGDQNDSVLLDWSERTPLGRNAKIVVASIDGGGFGEQALVTLLEHFQGVDANHDGDQEDVVLTAYDAGEGSVRSLGLGVAAVPAPLSAFASTAVLVSEQAQGADLNLDGDLLDQVLHTVQFVLRID